MRPCQRKHFIQKRESYEKQIKASEQVIKDQRERIMCFQGLINQLNHTIGESEDKGDCPDCKDADKL